MAERVYIKALLLDDVEQGLIPYITPATTRELGTVKVDGTSIRVDADGTIHSITQLEGTVGGITQSIWLNDGTLVPITSSIGNSITPVYLENGKFYQCAREIPNPLASMLPIGSIFYFPSSNRNLIESYGCYICDGSELDINNYIKLYQAIGNTFGTASTSTKFRLPKISDNRFIEGVGVMSSTVINHLPGLPNITGTFLAEAQGGGKPSGAFSTSKNKSGVHSGTGGAQENKYTFNASSSNSIYGNSNTVQPRSIELVPIIKAI